jgi:hypothetical protein
LEHDGAFALPEAVGLKLPLWDRDIDWTSAEEMLLLLV